MKIFHETLPLNEEMVYMANQHVLVVVVGNSLPNGLKMHLLMSIFQKFLGEHAPERPPSSISLLTPLTNVHPHKNNPSSGWQHWENSDMYM